MSEWVTNLQLRREVDDILIDSALARVHEQGAARLVPSGLQDLDFADLLHGKASTVSVPFPFASSLARPLAGGHLGHAPAIQLVALRGRRRGTCRRGYHLGICCRVADSPPLPTRRFGVGAVVDVVCLERAQDVGDVWFGGYAAEGVFVVWRFFRIVGRFREEPGQTP